MEIQLDPDERDKRDLRCQNLNTHLSLGENVAFNADLETSFVLLQQTFRSSQGQDVD